MRELTLDTRIEDKHGNEVEIMYNVPFEACKQALGFTCDKEAEIYFDIEYIHDDTDTIIKYCIDNNIEYTKLF